MKEILTIFNYIDGENDELFYSSAEPIKLYEYSFSSQRMGSSSITASFAYPFVLDDAWDGNQYVSFRGRKYFLRNKPTSSKDNTDARYNYNVEFIPKIEIQLSNVYFYDAVVLDAETDDKYKSNSTKVIFYGTLDEFVARLNASLQYSGLSDYTVVIDGGIVTEAKQVSFENKTFFEALQDSYELWNVPFYFVGENEIHFGEASTEIETVFKYGVNNSLLSIKKVNADYQIINRCTGSGSSENIPYYYPNNSPKGNISAAALSSNIKLSQENIHIKDYEKFSANIEPSDTVYWRSSVVSSRVVTVNGEEQYSGQERQVNIVNMQPVVDVFTVNFAMASDGRAVISTNTVRNGMDIGSALSRGIITKYTLTSVENPLSYNTVSDNGDGTLITSWLDAGAYTLTLEYTLAYVGVINYTYSTDIALSGKTEWSVSRDGNGTPIELSDIGISVDISPANGDGFTQNLLSKIAPSSSLQPPIYRESLGAERFYNAENNKYTNPDTGEFYQFENEYTNNNPREYITENEDIKPTIKGITNAAGQEIGRFLDVAYDTNDNDETDEEGNYLHPYFFVKLPKFNGAWGFNLFDHAIESGEMTIAMTSGNCAPCKFIIGVSDDDIQRNLVQVDSNGGLLRDEDGDVRCGREGKPGETPQPRQNDTENYEVWIALKKDTSTFGVIMPNAENNYKPLTGDSFVILNISLPQAYIDKAEEDLKDFIIRYMADNNSDKFDFSIEFSRIYIAEHPEIAAALDENSKLKIEYNGKTYSFFVSQYTYRANNEEALPEIKVELSDSISIEKGTIERTVNQIELNANKQVLNIDFLGYGRSYFLGKNYNDTASGIITFLRGLIIGEQRSGYGFAIKDKSVVGVLGALTLGAKKNKTSLDLQTGHIEGFRTGLRRITEDATLTASDYLVLVENPENSTIKLPANPEDGQAYRIHNAGFSQIIIDGNGNLITRSGKPAGTQAVNNGETAIIEIFFSSIVNQWYMSYSSESFFAKDADGNIYVKDGRGFYSNSFVSSRGTDDEAGGGSGTGLDVDTLWQVLGSATSEQINATHIPSLSISKITGLQDALDAKLEGITKGMVEAVLTGTVTSHNHDGRYAPLSGGLIPSQHLPSYVDDVLEYASMTAFPATGEAGKIYVALDTNLTYRWGGSSYVEISPSLALGHTSSTAYPGDEGAANASAILALQGLFTNGAANRVAHALTFSYSGGASETYDGSSAVTVTVPTAEQMSLWDRICALFGIDADGHVYVTGNRGFYGNSFVSSRGSDPESGGGSGQGIDEEAMWTILGTSGTEKIDATHIPALPISQITGLQGALASKLEGITAQMVVAALGYTPYDAAAISAASVAYASSSGTAGKVSQKLTVKNDGGSSSASAKTFDGSAAVTVTIPTTLPASDVYAWAKAATKPSYTWSEIGGKPSAFTPAAHKHVKADITDFPTSWAWSAITGRPTTLAGYGITDGVNSAKASGGLSAAVDGHVLTIGVASGYAVPTSAQISAWNLVASLFGVDSDGNVYVKGNRGFYGTSFLSARGSDPESGSSGSGLDEEAMWDILGTSGTETIDASHIPSLSALSGQLTNAQLAYDSISVAGVKVALGGSVSTAQIASALTAAGYKLTDTVTTLASLGITATAAELNRLDGITASTAELNCLDGISGPVQTQLNAKQATITGAATSIVSSNLTANRALVSSSGGKVAVSAVSATELGYLDGVTSNIQAQLNGKANTSALSAYLPLAGGTMTGNLTARNIILPNGYVLYSVEGESGGGMLRFRNGRTILGSIGASTTAATHIRSITGHITTGSSDAATYNVLDTGNYTSYTVTKTGGGASGTWRINISGNAGRAAYLTSTYTGSGGLQPPSYFNGMGLKVNMMSKPVVYSDVVVVNGYNGIGSDVPYINAIGFQKTSGDHGEVYHARGDYGGDSWGTWHKFLDEYNYTSYAVSLTGAQTISGAKTFSSPVTAPALTYSRKYVTRCNSVGWYRCFSFSLNNASCPTAILHVSRIYNTSDGESYVFAISLGYDGKVSITQLSGTAGKRIITKIRVAYVNSSTAYVDFYYSLSYSSGNEVYVSSSGYGVSQAPAQVNDTTSSFYEFETADGCKSDTYVTAGQYVYSPKGLFGLTEAQADSYAGSGYYKLAVGQQSPRKGASLLLYRDSTSYQSYIGWSTGSADHVVIGLANGTNDLGITNKKGAIKLTGQGTLTYNNYTVWHAGNDGAGSGLDADLLDGTQKSGLLTSAASTPATNLSVTVGGTTKSVAGLYATYLGGFPATAFDLSTNLGTCQDYGCYVIGLMQITDYTTSGNHANGELILIRQNGNNPAQKIIYSLSTMHSSTNVRFGYLLFSTNSFVMPCTFTHNGKKWAGFNVTTASSYTNGVVCKRDGLRLGERSTPFLLKYKVSNTGQILNSEVNDSLVVNGSDIIECGVSARSFIGALSGNASSATKLATARSLWGQPFDGSGNVSGDMTGVGNISMSGGINSRVYVGSGDDLSRIGFRSHKVEFKGHGYLHMGYYFRPGYGSSGETQAAVYIQNASASNSPVFTTTHAFENNGNAAHTGSLTAGSTITSGAHLFMKAATGRFVFNAAGSGFMMSMENGNFRLMSHNNTSYVSRLVEVDMSGNVGIKSTPASGYALTVAGAGYFSGALSLSRAGSVGLLVDTSFRNLSWTVDTSGGWARSLKATDPTGSTTLINAVGVFGAGQTPEYVYLGGTSYASPSMAITAAGNVGIGTTAPGYRLDVRGSGFFSGVLGANGMTLPYGGSSWISMASTPAVLKGAINQSTNSAHPLFRVKNSAGDAIVFGGLGSKTGFYGFTAERISSGSNSYDWATTWNVGTGHLTHNGAMTVGGLLTASAGLTTPQYVQVGSGRLKWDASANALYVEKSDGTACGLYATSFLSARGSDPESGSSELVPVVTLSKLTVGTRVSISVLDNAGLTADVREKMCDGTIGRVKAVFSDGSTEIWPVLHASEGFISFGYDTVAGGYQDTMNIYEITIPSKTTVIRVEHFER